MPFFFSLTPTLTFSVKGIYHSQNLETRKTLFIHLLTLLKQRNTGHQFDNRANRHSGILFPVACRRCHDLHKCTLGTGASEGRQIQLLKIKYGEQKIGWLVPKQILAVAS